MHAAALCYVSIPFITGNKQKIIVSYSPFPLQVLRYIIYEWSLSHYGEDIRQLAPLPYLNTDTFESKVHKFHWKKFLEPSLLVSIADPL